MALSAGLLLASCAHRKSTPTAAAVPMGKPVARAKTAPTFRTIEPVPSTPEQRLGTIRVIGAHGNFVLIETPSAAATAAVPSGYLLHCHPPGTVTGSSSADLRVSPERRQPFLVADVLSGVPNLGDVVYLAKEVATPSPPLRPIVPFSSVIPAAAPPETPVPTP